MVGPPATEWEKDGREANLFLVLFLDLSFSHSCYYCYHPTSSYSISIDREMGKGEGGMVSGGSVRGNGTDRFQSIMHVTYTEAESRILFFFSIADRYDMMRYLST